MVSPRAGIGKIVCIVLSVVLVFALISILYINDQTEKTQSARLQALQDEVRIYENELQELEEELSYLESGVSYSGEEAKILVGFVATAVQDIAYMEEKAEAYAFSPVLIIDCTMDMGVIEDILEAADESWEIMLYAAVFSEETNEDVLSVISYLADEGREHTGVFLLRLDYSTKANIQLLKEDGFLGYTSYNDVTPAAGQTEDGTVYFEYSYLTAYDEASLDSRISSLYNYKVPMIFALDMDSVKEGALTESDVTVLFDMLQSYTEKDDCIFATVADAVEELSAVNEIEAGNQESYAEQIAEIQARIDELEEIIDGIYDKYGQ